MNCANCWMPHLPLRFEFRIKSLPAKIQRLATRRDHMKETLNVQDIKNILQEISRIMDENKDYLCKLDGALGDGDIGLTMSKGFRAVVENLPNTSNENIGVVLMNSAVVMGETVASTMGTLMASAIIRGGKVTQGKSELTAEDLLTMTRAMVHALVERGKAKAGEKNGFGFDYSGDGGIRGGCERRQVFEGDD